MTAAVRHQTGLKRLAGALAVLCLVLFLLAIEQSQAVSLYRATRDGAAPAASRVADWARELPARAADGFRGMSATAIDPIAPLEALPVPLALSGEFSATDETTGGQVGAVSFDGAVVTFEGGEVLRTQPLRIAAGSEAFAPGRTFARRWNARPDAQIELRRVLPDGEARLVAPSSLCNGQAPGILAILHRADRVDMMLFRNGAWISATSPVTDICGAWTLRAR